MRSNLKAPFPYFSLPLPLVYGILLYMTIEQRFWAKVRKTRTCWIWTASKRAKGYGAFAYTRDRKMIQDRAHRFSWEIHKGPIPSGVCVLHNCPDGDNPACVNPAHLFLGTKADNNADLMAKGRYNYSRNPNGNYKRGPRKAGDYKYGEYHHGAKLNGDQVKELRRLRTIGWSFGRLSKHYGIAIGHVFRIVNRTVWRHIW